MSSSKLFPGEGKAVGRGDNASEPLTRRDSSAGGSGSRDHTPVVARYAILSAWTDSLGDMGGRVEGAPEITIQHARVVEGRGVTSSVPASVSAVQESLTNGEARTSTPARLSRVLTPHKGQSRPPSQGLAGRSAATALGDRDARGEQEEIAVLLQRRMERRSRRKLRRWANDRLFDVNAVQGPPGDDKEAVAEGEYGPLWEERLPSKFSALMAQEDTEARDRYLAGYGTRTCGWGGGRNRGRLRHMSRGQASALGEAETRFLRLEKRLRGILTQLVGSNAHMASFLEDIEVLLTTMLSRKSLLCEGGGSAGGKEENGTSEGGGSSRCCEALTRSLALPLYMRQGEQAALVLPLKDSAFLRLLVHGCCLYYGLRSHSEDLPQVWNPDAERVRAVVVVKPADVAAAAWSPSWISLCAFIKHSRLQQHLQYKHRGGGRCLKETTQEDGPITQVSTT